MRYWINEEEDWIGTTPDCGNYLLPAKEISKEEYEKICKEIKE